MPRASRRRSGSALAALVAALGIGLGAATAAVRPTTHTVVMQAVSFQPAVVTARVGEPIVWLNKDPFPHTVTAPGFDSKVIVAGKSWKHVATARGEFPYACSLHPTMKGTLRVE